MRFPVLTKIMKWFSNAELPLEQLRLWSAGRPILPFGFAALCGGYFGRPGEPPRWVIWEDRMRYGFARGRV
jgi:hypothetical protein